MDTNREDFSIAIRSAFLRKGTKQRFSLFALTVLCLILLFVEKIEIKPLNYFRSIVKDTIYRGSLIISYPSKGASGIFDFIGEHINLYKNYEKLVVENKNLKNESSKIKFLELENNQLRDLIDEELNSTSRLVSSKVIIDKKSPYLNSFIINIGTNKKIKNGMAVLNGKNFIGRIVDVNFFSSRVLLVSDLNSKIPIIVEPSGTHAILRGHGKNITSLEYLPKIHKIKKGDTIFTSGKEGIFSAGIPIGKAYLENDMVLVSLFSDLNQITYVNVSLEYLDILE